MAERATRRARGGRPVRRRDPERTRARILDAAFEEFCAHGLAGARVDSIAARARVNKRMLYYYFGSKEELFVELLRQKAGQVADVRARSPRDLAGALAYQQREQWADARWARLLMHEALAYGAGRIANERARREAWRGPIGAIEQAQAAGELPDDLDAAQLQLSLVALVTFPVAFPQFTRLITGRSPDDPRFLRARQRFLRTLARHLSPPRQPPS